jgi:hypothetical protein
LNRQASSVGPVQPRPWQIDLHTISQVARNGGGRPAQALRQAAQLCSAAATPMRKGEVDRLLATGPD